MKSEKHLLGIDHDATTSTNFTKKVLIQKPIIVESELESNMVCNSTETQKVIDLKDLFEQKSPNSAQINPERKFVHPKNIDNNDDISNFGIEDDDPTTNYDFPNFKHEMNLDSPMFKLEEESEIHSSWQKRFQK